MRHLDIHAAAESRAAAIRAAAERMASEMTPTGESPYPAIAGVLTSRVEMLCQEIAQRDAEIARLISERDALRERVGTLERTIDALLEQAEA